MLFDQFDTSLLALHTFLSTTGGRDKLGKFVHYGARGTVGVADLAMQHCQKGSTNYELAQRVNVRAKSLFVRIMNARRTVRWLSGIPMFLSLRLLLQAGKSPWNSKTLFFLNQSGLLWWTTLDHYRWLQEIDWIGGDSKKTKRVSFAGFVLSSLAGSVYFCRELHEYSKSDDTNDSKLFKLKLEFAKHILTLISVLHVSEIFLTHEWICGFTGMAASMIDIYNLYPRIPKKE